MKILQVCAYGAEYPGNFIKSLITLETKLSQKNVETIYAFVERAKNKDWCLQLQKTHKVYFLPEAKARILPQTYKIFKEIYRENTDIRIVHCHFELYDIPAKVMAPSHINVYWHLHDPIDIKKMKISRKILIKYQYKYLGKYAKLISVSEYYKNEIIKFGFPKYNSFTVLNGIDLSRINNKKFGKEKYDFLTFGWDFYRKGADLIFKAAEKLYNEGYNFKILFNGVGDTWHILNEYFNSNVPSYIIKGYPTNDVNQLFSDCRVFIQASRRETFSYAVCETAYSGMNVIASDIPGLEWAKAIPIVSFFDNEDINGLYFLMKKFLENDIYNEDVIFESKKIIANNYSLDVWAEKIINIYQEDVKL